MKHTISTFRCATQKADKTHLLQLIGKSPNRSFWTAQRYFCRLSVFSQTTGASVRAHVLSVGLQLAAETNCPQEHVSIRLAQRAKVSRDVAGRWWSRRDEFQVRVYAFEVVCRELSHTDKSRFSRAHKRAYSTQKRFLTPVYVPCKT